MPIGGVAIATGLGGLIVGFVGGALSRQPEINELKKQVKSLQGEVDRLQGVIRIQNNQIHELEVRYVALKGWNYIEKAKQRNYIKGCYMFQYAFKEYLEMLIEANDSNKVNLNDREIKFYNAFGTIFNKADITEKNRSIVIEYVKEKYGNKIDHYEGPDFSAISEYLA